jgi:hypothetical protein
MDEFATDAAVAATAPAINLDLLHVFRRYSARSLLEAYRDYCYAEAQACQRDGWDGMGWLELYDLLEDHMPPASDSALNGKQIVEPEPVFAGFNPAAWRRS